MGFSDYIVYVDESGDHSLEKIDSGYPMFVLAFCIFEKSDYINHVVPAVQNLKFKHFGHDMVVLHEHEIRKSKPPFDILLNAQVRQEFMADMAALIQESPFKIVASCIRKIDFNKRYNGDGNPYHVAMRFGLERVFLEMQGRRQRGRITHIIFEKRGKKEDAELELEFRRIVANNNPTGISGSLDIIFADKQSNSAGLQIADMVARPIGRYLLRPEQENRAYEILQEKLRRAPDGRTDGWGLKCFP